MPPYAPKKKLTEVALSLEAINKASACEESIRHVHPSTLHLSWRVAGPWPSRHPRR